MKDIKFRAWLNHQKQMVNWEELHLEKDDDGLFLWWESTGEDNFQLMQYTGLKDKNGFEIYEDDVIKRFRESIVLGKKTKVEFYQKIVYVEKYAQYLLEDKNGVQEHASWASTGEVIGNIHEEGMTLQ